MYPSYWLVSKLKRIAPVSAVEPDGLSEVVPTGIINDFVERTFTFLSVTGFKIISDVPNDSIVLFEIVKTSFELKEEVDLMTPELVIFPVEGEAVIVEPTLKFPPGFTVMLVDPEDDTVNPVPWPEIFVALIEVEDNEVEDNVAMVPLDADKVLVSILNVSNFPVIISAETVFSSLTSSKNISNPVPGGDGLL